MSKDKRMTKAELESRDTMAIMGDEDSVTGFLIAGRFISCCAVPSKKLFPLLPDFGVYRAAFICLKSHFAQASGRVAVGKARIFTSVTSPLRIKRMLKGLFSNLRRSGKTLLLCSSRRELHSTSAISWMHIQPL